ncbi:helix-turn-helix transcriptional regulator [Psychroserpens luteolus]|uniref:helix-turn-helix transcriptional regulator n=1 Tax=Psychroserpens luteolus TaxID=2855840 RepID=UPI001E49FF0B|nr:AraC family transcriptional regulator [Psychroserpens luteolus]MCD2259510.1 AraC family transcriptional regulator [Psychroserpens luteolus]
MNSTPIPRIYVYKQIIEAKLFIDDNFHEKINLELIANQACFSKFHFHRLFKECYNKTPLEYLTYLRLNKAKTLLSKGISIQEVCSSVGFESTSSFIKLFKKNELMTPLEFSKMRTIKRKQIEQNPLNFIPSDYAQYLGWKI